MTDAYREPPGNSLSDLAAYLRFVDVLPDDVTERVCRYRNPLTGERRQYHYNNHILLAEIHHLHEQLDRVPTSADLEGHGTISLQTYDRFGTFPRAVEAAGFEPTFTGAQEKARYIREYEDLIDPDEANPWRRSPGK